MVSKRQFPVFLPRWDSIEVVASKCKAQRVARGKICTENICCFVQATATAFRTIAIPLGDCKIYPACVSSVIILFYYLKLYYTI